MSFYQILSAQAWRTITTHLDAMTQPKKLNLSELNQTLAPLDELWWCNTHQRRAAHIDSWGKHKCDPHLPGIMIPCNCVNLTGIAEIVPVKD